MESNLILLVFAVVATLSIVLALPRSRCSV